ncbi:chitin synthase-domain-containing protein [Hygrophoropsis aurantiaca]|uniref:Chitin synthase-domain-containing protein n=1 Tax=Hygrophoropsis aurantiaca TaxID=72124 RepID=A0ACB7ZQS0_9AGAM|nr:chitin synthase-domain-containing protein [Hygrophoropsis aurantiaca]
MTKVPHFWCAFILILVVLLNDIEQQWSDYASFSESVFYLQHTASLVISSVGTPFERTAAHVPSCPIIEILPPRSFTRASTHDAQPFLLSVADFWGLVYALFTAYVTQENIPISRCRFIKIHAQLRSYVLRSGLGPTALVPSASKEELFLSRTAFWQGAGTHGHHARGWLPADAESTINALASFPTVQSFTRIPVVIASHPLQPQNPNATSRHDRVNKWWNEAGTIDKHREYVQRMLDGPAALLLMMSWDEIVWIKVLYFFYLFWFTPDCTPLGELHCGIYPRRREGLGSRHDMFIICQVPCYTEGESSLRKTIGSLAQLKYDDKRKLILVVMPLSAPVTIDQHYPLSFLSLGESAKQHNMGKVYPGLYECAGHVVPYLVVVKVGKPTELSRPGNHSKRDSQMVIMRFLNKLEIYHQIKNIIGVNPTYEYLFTVDADTTVEPLSVNRLISANSLVFAVKLNWRMLTIHDRYDVGLRVLHFTPHGEGLRELDWIDSFFNVE